MVWTLFDDGPGTILQVSHAGIESFPQDDPAFSREAGIGGWTWFICERLPAYLANSTP